MKKRSFSQYVLSQKIFVIIALSVSFPANITHTSSSQIIIDICGDKAGWPPYTYEKEELITGASVDLIRLILKQANYKPNLQLLPWKRCLTSVEKGNNKITLDATYSKERAEKYYISDAFYSIHSGLFYTTSHFKEKPVINTTEDMQQYTYCGIHGYNYSMYKLPKNNLDTKSWNEETRIQKLRQKRCDFIIGDIEILQGFSKMGKINIENMESIPIPSAKPKTFHALITKDPQGKKLLDTLNNGLEKLKQDGTYHSIFSDYGIETTPVSDHSDENK